MSDPSPLPEEHPALAEHLRRTQEGKKILRGDSFILWLGKLLGDPSLPSTLDAIREKRFTLGRTDATSRVVNHWEAEGVVEDPRTSGQGWRRYSVMDLVWLGAILQLRQFGVPNETLRKAKDNIRSLDPMGVRQEAPHLFEVYVLRALLREPAFILVFADGDVELASEHEYKTTPLLYGLSDHVRISINQLLQKLYPKMDLRANHRPGADLSDKETSVLLALRSPDNKRITVRMKEGEPSMLEMERDGTGKTVQELLSTSPYGELTVKQQDGQTVHLSQILREKL